MDAGAIERLGERLCRSGAQEASVGVTTRERDEKRQIKIAPEQERERGTDQGFGIE